MMQTITTKIVINEEKLPLFVVAKTVDGNSTCIAVKTGNTDEAHCKAAKALKEELGWKNKMTGGHTKDGMCFVVANDKANTIQ